MNIKTYVHKKVFELEKLIANDMRRITILQEYDFEKGSMLPDQRDAHLQGLARSLEMLRTAWLVYFEITEAIEKGEIR